MRRRPLCSLSSEGGTRISDAGCEARNAGDEVRRAQSSGEWPGVRRTFLRGFGGGAVWVGGGARPEADEGEDEDEDGDGGPRLGRGLVEGRDGGGIKLAGPRDGGAMIPPREGAGASVGFDMEGGLGSGFSDGGLARWAELRAGKEGGGRLSISSSPSSGEVARLNDGMGFFALALALADARGVVGDEGFVKSGGGGIALRSSSALDGASLRFVPSSSPFTIHSLTFGGGDILGSSRRRFSVPSSRGMEGGADMEGRRIHSRSESASGERR